VLVSEKSGELRLQDVAGGVFERLLAGQAIFDALCSTSAPADVADAA